MRECFKYTHMTVVVRFFIGKLNDRKSYRLILSMVVICARRTHLTGDYYCQKYVNFIIRITGKRGHIEFQHVCVYKLQYLSSPAAHFFLYYL